MVDLFFQLTYTLAFTSAFHIGSGYGLAGVADATVVRNQTHDLYVPGSTIKGRTRWHLTKLLMLDQGRFPNLVYQHDLEQPCPLPEQTNTQGFQEAPSKTTLCPLCNLFGSPLVAGNLIFTDARLTEGSNLVAQVAPLVGRQRQKLAAYEQEQIRRGSQVEQRSQVSLSRRRRVAHEELLFVTEVGQAGLCFEGGISGRLPTWGRELTFAQEERLPEDLGWLLAALLGIEQVGGRKSRGLGYCQFTIAELIIYDRNTATPRALEGAAILQALQQRTAQMEGGQ